MERKKKARERKTDFTLHCILLMSSSLSPFLADILHWIATSPRQGAIRCRTIAMQSCWWCRMTGARRESVCLYVYIYACVCVSREEGKGGGKERCRCIDVKYCVHEYYKGFIFILSSCSFFFPPFSFLVSHFPFFFTESVSRYVNSPPWEGSRRMARRRRRTSSVVQNTSMKVGDR